MSLLNKIGDGYHKYVYRHLTKISSITDKTNLCLTDSILALSCYAPEIIAGYVMYLGYRFMNVQNSTDAKNIASHILIDAVPVLGTVMLSYFPNMWRTPIEKKLQLHPEQINRQDELEYTVRKLNELADTKPLTFDEAVQRSDKALDDFVLRIEGYLVPHAKKIKKSLFSKHFSDRGTLGLFNPFFHEIVTMNSNLFMTIPHEKAHLVGYAKEAEAQFVSYASLLESKDKSLQYIAYWDRLEMLVRRDELQTLPLNERTKNELQTLPLNERTKNELQEFHEGLSMNINNLTTYNKLKYKLGRFFRSLFLKSLGQGNIQRAYRHRPLELISAYDPPQ